MSSAISKPVSSCSECCASAATPARAHSSVSAADRGEAVSRSMMEHQSNCELLFTQRAVDLVSRRQSLQNPKSKRKYTGTSTCCTLFFCCSCVLALRAVGYAATEPSRLASSAVLYNCCGRHVGASKSCCLRDRSSSVQRLMDEQSLLDRQASSAHEQYST
jgi:hypothetical protein